MSTVHELKTFDYLYDILTHPDPTQRKTLEVRLNDRNFVQGDFLHLRRTDSATGDYTGESTYRLVTHVLSGRPWLPDGYVALSLFEQKPLEFQDAISDAIRINGIVEALESTDSMTTIADTVDSLPYEDLRQVLRRFVYKRR